jgi:hypothetical protein
MPQTSKLEIGLSEIRNNFIIPRLARTPFRFKVFISDGEYVKAAQKGNIKKGTINAVMNVENTDILVLGGGLKAVSMVCSITFLVPVNDDPDVLESDYAFLEEFKKSLEGIFPVSENITMTNEEGVSYVGAFSGGYPVPGMLMQRQYIGKSIEYTCTFEVAYLRNAINSSGVLFYVWSKEDGEPDELEPLPVASFSFNRRNTLMANLYSNSTNGEAKTYAESSAFGVDLSFPAISPYGNSAGELLWDFVSGNNSANKVLAMRIEINENKTTTIEQDMIIGEAFYEGGGIDNMSMRVSFVPYIEAEDA